MKPWTVVLFKWYRCLAQGRDSLEDVEHTNRSGTVRTELKIQEVAALVHANCSQTVDDLASASTIVLATKS
jgi:hypothetical protein